MSSTLKWASLVGFAEHSVEHSVKMIAKILKEHVLPIKTFFNERNLPVMIPVAAEASFLCLSFFLSFFFSI